MDNYFVIGRPGKLHPTPVVNRYGCRAVRPRATAGARPRGPRGPPLRPGQWSRGRPGHRAPRGGRRPGGGGGGSGGGSGGMWGTRRSEKVTLLVALKFFMLRSVRSLM